MKLGARGRPAFGCRTEEMNENGGWREFCMEEQKDARAFEGWTAPKERIAWLVSGPFEDIGTI